MCVSVLVSVVVVTYNHEKYITKALQSIIEQELFEHCEVLVGDDGSRDNTVCILNDFSNKHPNIHVFAHDNVGISQNVYDLFCKCKGKYIAVLEGDDYWTSPMKLNIQIQEIENNDCIASASNSLIVDDDGNEYGYKNNRKKPVVIGKKEVEKYGTALWMPSGLLFRNIFLNSSDETLKVIRDASRMGGNHSGLINLLGSKGMIYLDSDVLCVWRVNMKKDGFNYSSKSHNSSYELLESMNKYLMYQRVLGINQEDNILYSFKNCKKQMKKDIINEIGYSKYFIKILNYNIKSSIFGRIASKIKRKMCNE